MRSTLTLLSRMPRIALAAMLSALTCCASPSDPSPPPSVSAPDCPSSHGGVCLGALEAGTYSTTAFSPTLTYRVPDGWANYEDLPGNFLLVPPSGTLDGVDAGTSDYVGIYTSIAALNPDCETHAAAIGTTPAEIAAWLAGTEGLVVTPARDVEVGGLTGLAVDLTLGPDGGITCEGLDFPILPLFQGLPPSQLEHAMIPGLTIRLYLLAYGDGTLAIEVDDHDRAADLDEYDAIVQSISFAV